MESTDLQDCPSIQEPSAETAFELKKALGEDILESIAGALRSAMTNEVYVDWSLFDVHYFSDTLRVVEHLRESLGNAPETMTGRICGPELYRWIGNFKWAVKNNDTGLYHQWLLNLSHLLLCRVIVVSDHADLPLTFYLKVSGHGHLHLPQIDGPVSETTIDRNWVKARLSGGELLLFSLDEPLCIPLEHVLCLVDGFHTDEKPNSVGETEIYLHQSGAVLREMVAELSETASGPVQQDEMLRVIPWDKLLTDPYNQAIMERLAEGTRYLQRYSEGSYQEVCAVMDGISLLTGGRFVGSSDIWYHGIAVLNPDDTWTEITFADHLIHEGAHIALHALNELMPVMYNPFEEGAPSPIRSDPRPLYGTFHATFVFMRLVQFFARIVDEGEVSEEVEFRYHRHLKGFYDGMDTLSKYADLTPSGQRVFGEMAEYHQELKKQMAKPQPEKFQNLARDYVI
jgi:HEXXH motif-containing protein